MDSAYAGPRPYARSGRYPDSWACRPGLPATTTGHRFPHPSTGSGAPSAAFAPTHRCGTVPDFHRVPSYDAPRRVARTDCAHQRRGVPATATERSVWLSRLVPLTGRGMCAVRARGPREPATSAPAVQHTAGAPPQTCHVGTARHGPASDPFAGPGGRFEPPGPRLESRTGALGPVWPVIGLLPLTVGRPARHTRGPADRGLGRRLFRPDRYQQTYVDEASRQAPGRR